RVGPLKSLAHHLTRFFWTPRGSDLPGVSHRPENAEKSDNTGKNSGGLRKAPMWGIRESLMQNTARVAQSGERRCHIPEVAGAEPAASTEPSVGSPVALFRVGGCPV